MDGYTQPGSSPNSLVEGNNAVLLIQLEGNQGTGLSGLVISAGSSTVRGLAFNHFNGYDGTIQLETNGGNIIQGNFIGTNTLGNTGVGYSSAGVEINGSPNNLIGGTSPSTRNLLSGGNKSGIRIIGVEASGNVVQGNYIGTNAAGNADLGNHFAGVYIENAPNNLIGGVSPGARNVISGNDYNGVDIRDNGATNNVIQGNYIGTNITGTVALGNSHSGVFLDAVGINKVGGSTVSARNLISGNGYYGVELDSASNNVIQGNYIGTNAAGNAAIGNVQRGVYIFDSAYNIIGGAAPGEGNLISGNDSSGVTIGQASSTNNKVQGNYIGTDSTGTVALGNSGTGITISGVNNLIGGTAPGEGNLISGNDTSGISIGSTGSPYAINNVVQGNYIGTDVTGTADMGNTQDGVYIGNAAGNTIGGAVAGARNLISGNNRFGVFLAEMNNEGVRDNLIQGNYIGTDVSGTTDIGNSLDGVRISGAPGNIVGGIAPAAGNIIAFNGRDGISVSDSVLSSIENLLASNSIFSNDQLGINLLTIEPTLNDPCDPDGGPNSLQNTPVLTSATSGGGSTTIMGTLNSTPNTTFTLQFFSNVACDPSGYGEGQTHLGSTTVTTDGNCNANFTANLPMQVPIGQFVTSIATNPSNNSSEFSACTQVSSLNVTQTPGTTTAIVTATSTSTIAPSSTPTSTPACVVLPTGAFTSCSSTTEYFYSFTFFSAPACPSPLNGDEIATFSVAPSDTGPWTDFDQRTRPVSLQHGWNGITGTLTETGIPAQFAWYRIKVDLDLDNGVSVSNTTPPAFLCNQSTPTPTIAGSTPVPSSTHTSAVAVPSSTATTQAASPTSVTQTATAVITSTPTPCTITFSDVPSGSTFYSFIRCLACRGIISGYTDGTFRPDNNITRSQIAKMVSNAAGINDDPGEQIYEDVDIANPFYVWINRLSSRSYMGGYPCGSVPEEPCISPNNRPYFRPFANATRAQLAKIVSNAAGFGDVPGEQIFADVEPDNGFYVWIQRLASRGIMGGYPCGGEGEPCDDANRPYFRPYNNVTRGQTSKIIAGAFFPNCQTP